MTNITVVFAEKTLLLKSGFAKKAARCGSPESIVLQKYVKLYPDYEITIHQITRNAAQEHYRGLTYDFMENYILEHEPRETVDAVHDEFCGMIDISKCHSTGRRYPIIKNWFFEKYPEIKNYGMDVKAAEEEAA